MFRRLRRLSTDERLALLLAIATVVKGLFWIALMGAFRVADEPSHYENIAFRGEHFATPYCTTNEPYGTTIHEGTPPDVKLVWERTNQLNHGGRYVPGVRSIHEELELRQMARDPKNREGTGRLTSASYPGFYYDSAVPVYEIFRGTSVLTRLAALRCVSLAYGVLAVIFTFFAARLVMRSRAVAVAAALVVMLQPMESQMTAAVNNDAGVIGLGALLFYLQVRLLVRAPEIPSLRWAVLIGLTAACLLFTKPHGYALMPGCAIACAWLVAVNIRDRRAWTFAAVAAACASLFFVLSVVHLHDTGQTQILQAAPSPEHAPTPLAAVQPRTFLTFLRSLDHSYWDYLFRSFFGAFGWLEFWLPYSWTNLILEFWKIVPVGALVAIVLRLTRLSRWLSLRGFLFSAFTALFTLFFILFAEHRFRLLGIIGVIQGRNFLMGLPALAIVVAASFAALVPARLRSLSAATLVVCAATVQLGSVIYIFWHYYGA